MKIGFDAKRAFLNSSGLGNYSRTTLTALLEYYPENHYLLFTPKIIPDLFNHYRKFDVISPDSSLSKIFKSLWRSFSVSRYLEKHEVDIFHGLSNELPEGVNKYNVPAVVTIHDLIFMRFPEFYKAIDRNIYYRKVKYACNAATKVIAISKQTKEDLIRYFEIPEGKIEVVYQAINPVFFTRQNTDAIREKYNLPEKFILSVGTLESRKNQLSILMAIQQHKINLPVVFVGNPTSYSAQLLKYVEENKMEKQVRFLTGLPETDLAGLYQAAELSVYISLFEGFGLPVIESMASACPVITSNVSVLPETAADCAILCDPHNQNELGLQIQRITENDSLRKELVDKGSERAKVFHPEKYAQNLVSLYKEIIA